MENKYGIVGVAHVGVKFPTKREKTLKYAL